jgi:phosphoribosylformimino-5-aminoimidazole carboxamide ribotide isomerase
MTETMRIIPCIDIYRDKVVRLTHGDFNKVKEYVTNPLDQAVIFRDCGLEYLHIVDLEASKTGLFTQMNIVREIIQKTQLRVDVGGGIRTSGIIRSLIETGVEYVNIGTMSVLQPETLFEWASEFGHERILPSFDCANGQICIQGWEQRTNSSVYDLIQGYVRNGFRRFALTDVTRDGTLTGINLAFFENFKNQLPDIQIIAGGGVSSLSDIVNVAKLNLFGVVVGKAIYENKIPINQLKEMSYALQKNNTLS